MSPENKEQLEGFIGRATKFRARQSRIIKWHLDAFTATDGKVPLPYSPIDVYCGLTHSDWDNETRKYVVDTEKTLDTLSAIAKYAASMPGVTVEKTYDSHFSLDITLPASDEYDGSITFHYSANRETVCTKRVVGTKVVEAYTTPERIEDIVEWDCQKISLLSLLAD